MATRVTIEFEDDSAASDFIQYNLVGDVIEVGNATSGCTHEAVKLICVEEIKIVKLTEDQIENLRRKGR